MAKKPKAISNNPYHVSNEAAEEIRALSNQDLVGRASLEYKNWHASVKLKKNDPKILETKEAIKSLSEEIKSDPEYIKLEEEFERKKEEIVTEELAQFKEELKNLNQPYAEDVKNFRGLFRVAMDEISKRKDAGTMK